MPTLRKVGTSATDRGRVTADVRPRACIVDDHDDVRQWLTTRLESLGIEICGVARTVEEGVLTIASQRPDLAVVDGRLPDGRGIDLCRAVAASSPEVILILHTGTISPAEEAEARTAGVARIALKSIQGADLLAAVTQLAVGSRTARG